MYCITYSKRPRASSSCIFKSFSRGELTLLHRLRIRSACKVVDRCATILSHLIYSFSFFFAGLSRFIFLGFMQTSDDGRQQLSVGIAVCDVNPPPSTAFTEPSSIVACIPSSCNLIKKKLCSCSAFYFFFILKCTGSHFSDFAASFFILFLILTPVLYTIESTAYNRRAENTERPNRNWPRRKLSRID